LSAILIAFVMLTFKIAIHIAVCILS